MCSENKGVISFAVSYCEADLRFCLNHLRRKSRKYIGIDDWTGFQK